ncbi:MAG: hydroxyacid dehydrogenase, partial [Oscillibacter sp.]|nr:hydroxyacid dehydrogenase [Oscillibacter sp.]
IEFNQHLVLEEGGLEREGARVVALAEEKIAAGQSVVVYTRRDRFDLPDADADKQLEVSVRISDAVTGVIGALTVRPSFIVAKGGITSSDVGTKALRVRRATVMGQIKPGVPVWLTGPESKFPNLPYVIFPGNVGEPETLREAVEVLMGV